MVRDGVVDDRITAVPVYYVDVSASLDVDILVKMVTENIHVHQLHVVATVQFLSSLDTLRARLIAAGYEINIPTVPGLHAGEVLGCTAPNLGPQAVVL